MVLLFGTERLTRFAGQRFDEQGAGVVDQYVQWAVPTRCEIADCIAERPRCRRCRVGYARKLAGPLERRRDLCQGRALRAGAEEERRQPPLRAQQRLRRTIELSNQRTGKPFFRAQMRLARVYVLRAMPREALTVLREITSRNPGHARAQRLLDRTQAAASTVAVRPSAVDAGVAGMTPSVDAGTPKEPARPARPGGGEVTGDYDSLVRRAEKYSYAGNQAKAMALYQKALEKRAGGVEALTGLGYAYLDQRRTGAWARRSRWAVT